VADPIPSRFEVVDERFAFFHGDSWLERLHSGCRWTEGPAYFPAGRYLVFSDIPNNRLLRWDETSGAVSVFREPSHYANGHTADRQGRLVSCEHGRRAVSRTGADGSVTVLADAWDGKRLNSPNDIVEHSGGTLWFTDPGYGIASDYEGYRADSEIGASQVYRLDPATGQVDLAAGGFDSPNGLAFSADERLLYVSDSERRHLRAFTVAGDLSLSGGGVLATCDAGTFDGVRVDSGRGRPALPRPRRHADRQAPRARDRGQLHLRRPEAQPAPDLRDQLAVLGHGQRHRRGLPARRRVVTGVSEPPSFDTTIPHPARTYALAPGGRQGSCAGLPAFRGAGSRRLRPARLPEVLMDE
jgi:gluconolactonase